MQFALFALLLTLLTAPVSLAAQSGLSTASSLNEPELRLILEPGPTVEGVPITFVFRLTNVGHKDLRIPDPNIDCGNEASSGSVLLEESWQPQLGLGLGKGKGICDFGGSTLPSPPIMETARNWRVLKPGESFYVEEGDAALHFDAGKPGVYTFSAAYLPPLLSAEEIKALHDMGIDVPRQRVTSGSLRYDKR